MHYMGKYAKDAPPQYQMDRSIIHIPSPWDEWYVGSKTVPPIDFLEREYGPNWRKAEKDRIWYNKRKAIIRLVHDLSEQNKLDKKEAMSVLDDYRIAMDKSINWMAQRTKEILGHFKI